jgi:uncharacterized protein involved in exopolysaccharide biosynthesis
LASVKLRELEGEEKASRAVYESFLVRAREIHPPSAFPPNDRGRYG